MQRFRRKKLPSGIAYLLPKHPVDNWKVHTNFGQLAAFWLQIHNSLRLEGSDVISMVEALRLRDIDRATFQEQFVAGLNGFLQHLDNHHRIDDSVYFPRFQQLDARMVAGFDLLEADHTLIHQRVLSTIESARTLLSARDAELMPAADRFLEGNRRTLSLLLQHLADEEELVIPALLEHGEWSVKRS